MSASRNPKTVALIQAVRRQKVLYDYRLKKYMDEAFKQTVWADVAKECGYRNGEEAQKVWEELKNHFMICLRNVLVRRARANYNQNPVSLPPEEEQNDDALNTGLNYYSDMRFIVPFRDKKDPELERLIQLVKPLVMRSNENNDNADVCQIKAFSASAETQTPTESIHMDITPLCNENMSDRDICLRSFFDAMFRTTSCLPVHLQNNVKQELLRSVNNAELAAEEEKPTTYLIQ